jgi:hypothetical protein
MIIDNRQRAQGTRHKMESTNQPVARIQVTGQDNEASVDVLKAPFSS